MSVKYELAKDQYAEIGVDTEAVLAALKEIPVSVHCWQIDDFSGFETLNNKLTGGITVTGNAAGRPETKEDYLYNLTKALDLIPGKKKLALHAIYLDNRNKFIERNQIEPKHFSQWVDYAKEHRIGLDFNPTYFSHEKAADNFTLASPDRFIREFWIEHGIRSRKVGEYFGKALGEACITNHWIPDGYKDYTIDKLAPRLRLKESLDKIFADPIDKKYNIDSLESKLFGLGLESYTVGSHEFYTNYCAVNKNCIICMDMGHYHPTETVSAKISSYLAFGIDIMLHVSRGVRWDSDHVVSFDDETKEVMLEIARQKAFDKVHIGTDYFDASINRIAATVLGVRNVKKAILYALLETSGRLIKYENENDLTARLVYAEEQKTLPYEAVWEEFCERENMPGYNWYQEVR